MNKKRGWKGARFESDKGSSTDRRVFNIKLLEGYYCNQDYILDIYKTNEITTGGLLLVGKLEPKIPFLPEFWFRWDAKKEELDVDMYGDLEHREDWENSRNGYKGHKTEKFTNDRRNFKALIETPKLYVFQGIMSFNLELDLGLNNGFIV